MVSKEFSMKGEVIIYTLSDPLTNEVRYVGKTSYRLSTRLYSHMRDETKCHRVNWIKSLTSKHLRPIIEGLAVTTKEEWSKEEIFYIAYFKFLGFNLTNMTIGGEGTEYSKESRDKISKALTGIKRSNETKRKISELTKAGICGNKGKSHSENHRNKISIALMGRARPKEVVDKMRLGQAKKHLLQLTLNDIVIKEWESISLCSKETGFCKGNIIKCCKHNIDSEGYEVKTAYGFKWQYKQ